MPRRKKGGVSFRTNNDENTIVYRSRQTDGDGNYLQEYGKVTKVLGGRRFEVQCDDGSLKKCTLAGVFKKKDRVELNDTVLVNLGITKGTGIICFKYTKVQHNILLKKEGLNTLIFTEQKELDEDGEEIVDFDEFEDIDIDEL